MSDFEKIIKELRATLNWETQQTAANSIEQLVRERDVYKKTLQFYADENNFGSDSGINNMERNGLYYHLPIGSKARQILAQHATEPKE